VRATKVVVDADAEDVVGEVRIGRQRRVRSDTRERVGECSKIHVEVFELRGPLVGEPPMARGTLELVTLHATVPDKGQLEKPSPRLCIGD